jgi:hypothetical protein
MILETFEQQPLELKDYTVSYTEWLAPVSDRIIDVETSVTRITSRQSATGMAPATADLEVSSVTRTDDAVTIWVEGGTSGYSYKVTIKATTEGGRVDESELQFNVREI